MENGRPRPTAEEVIGRLKDDGDFDSLRLKIVRKVKENEELRGAIVSEVKQSVVLNEEGSEKMKLRELSDAIYQELGSKIMGQISDEVWRVIRSYENDIKGTVESVYERIVNPEAEKLDNPSPSKQALTDRKEDHPSHVTSFACERNNESDGNQHMDAPPGFGSSDQQSSKAELIAMPHDDQPQSSDRELDQPEADALPPGFSSPGKSADLPGGVGDEDPDVPPGFG